MTSLTIVRRIAARPDIVFEALTEASGIASWWGPEDGPVLLVETDVRPGGRYRVRFRKLDGSEHESCGEYLEISPPYRLVMSWRWIEGGHADEAGETSQIEMDLRAVDDSTELTFTHARLQSDASGDGHSEGWNGSLDKLERRFIRTDA